MSEQEARPEEIELAREIARLFANINGSGRYYTNEQAWKALGDHVRRPLLEMLQKRAVV